MNLADFSKYMAGPPFHSYTSHDWFWSSCTNLYLLYPLTLRPKLNWGHLHCDNADRL
jgi:hypothetical protein